MQTYDKMLQPDETSSDKYSNHLYIQGSHQDNPCCFDKRYSHHRQLYKHVNKFVHIIYIAFIFRFFTNKLQLTRLILSSNSSKFTM